MGWGCGGWGWNVGGGGMVLGVWVGLRMGWEWGCRFGGNFNLKISTQHLKSPTVVCSQLIQANDNKKYVHSLFWANIKSLYPWPFAGNPLVTGDSWHKGPVKWKSSPWYDVIMYIEYTCSSVPLTHWGWVTHICDSKLTIIGSDNGLSPEWCQAIIWANAGILLIGTLGTNFSDILNKIHAFSCKKMHSKTSSAKWPPFCLGLNVLMQ